MSKIPSVKDILTILDDTLQLEGRVVNYDESTEVLGSIPEFDSMAVVNVIVAIEETYGFTIEDDEITADTFETVGSLYHFVRNKLE